MAFSKHPRHTHKRIALSEVSNETVVIPDVLPLLRINPRTSKLSYGFARRDDAEPDRCVSLGTAFESGVS